MLQLPVLPTNSLHSAK